MKKNNKLHLAIDSEMKAKLQKRAQACGMTLTAYCLFILTNAKPKVEMIDD